MTPWVFLAVAGVVDRVEGTVAVVELDRPRGPRFVEVLADVREGDAVCVHLTPEDLVRADAGLRDPLGPHGLSPRACVAPLPVDPFAPGGVLPPRTGAAAP